MFVSSLCRRGHHHVCPRTTTRIHGGLLGEAAAHPVAAAVLPAGGHDSLVQRRPRLRPEGGDHAPPGGPGPLRRQGAPHHNPRQGAAQRQAGEGEVRAGRADAVRLFPVARHHPPRAGAVRRVAYFVVDQLHVADRRLPPLRQRGGGGVHPRPQRVLRGRFQLAPAAARGARPPRPPAERGPPPPQQLRGRRVARRRRGPVRAAAGGRRRAGGGRPQLAYGLGRIVHDAPATPTTDLRGAAAPWCSPGASAVDPGATDAEPAPWRRGRGG